MGALFSPPKAPPVAPAPPVPSATTAAVLEAARDADRRRAAASGRASTYLTNPSHSRDADPSAKRLLTETL
jgi:hypothetical protein